MKIQLAALALVFASTTAQARDLNLFDCSSEDGTVEIGYSSSSFTGAPQLHVTIDGQVVFPPSRGQFSDMIQIKTEKSIFGTFVYGLDSSRTPVDAPSYVYGFFIPKVSPNGNSQEPVSFDSMFLKGNVGGHIPQWVPAQRIQEATKISCKAQAVLF
jgi:hypothetical protein